MSYAFKKLKVSAIHLDQNNPRFPPVTNQRGALHAMLNEQGDKIYNLASDMAQHGLDPSKRLIIFVENGKYIDGDGNRRITVLKILETPDLILGHDSYNKFKELSNNLKNRKIDEVECVVFQSRAAIRHWLEINHDGEQEGRGQIPWKSEQKQRFRGAKTIGLLAKEKLRDEKLISDKQFDLVNVTTLTRLLESKVGKIALSIEVKNGKVSFRDLDALQKVYKGLTGQSVKEVYHKEDRERFLLRVLGSKVLSGKTRRTKRIKGTDKPIFGEVLVLKPGLVNNIYCDICDIYERSKNTGRFVEILGFSMRLILDVAAREYFSKKKYAKILKQDDVYKEYIKLIKDKVSQKDKTTLSIDSSIKNLIEEPNVEALLAKLAHGSVHASMQMVLNLSYIVGPILKIHFSKRSS